ncbi:hypothetical protein CLV58_10972 [Spirosoma oryzae]|uniref:Bulb-type lectin domain-containing protein n=1 Tax=Spirosoma oryzae TaxID=1469603 RepID=A0A2T0SY57_9BACT|nr:hypothetical protein CLV58_10972 [Spirosoma oryzae]
MKKNYQRETRLYWLRVWLLFVSATAAHAQTTQTPIIQWQRLLGRSYGSSPYQPRVVRANSDGYAVLHRKVIRLDDSGNTIWETILPDPPEYPGYYTITTHIAAAPDGGFGVLAYNRFKWSLFRLNADGSIRWNKTFVESTETSTSATREFAGLICTADGGFLAAATMGYSRSSFGTELYKFDAAGNNTITSSVNIPAGNEPRTYSSVRQIVQMPDGTYTLVGRANGASSSPADWVVKLDSQLAVVWQKNKGGRGLDRVIVSPYDNTAVLAVGSATGTDTRSLMISANGDITDGVTLANRANFTTSFLVAGANPNSHTIVDVVSERQGDIRLQTVVGQTLSYQQKLGGSGTETVTDAVAGADGGFLVIGTTTSTDGDIQGKTNTDAEVWLVKVGPVSNNVYSVKSGNWNDPSVWSCNCVPAAWQNVTISDTHTVRLDATMPAAACLNLEIVGTFSMQGSSITINGASVTLDDTNVVTN